MATELRLPRMSEEMEEGTVSRWLKQEGDTVEKGEPLVEVETEKVIVEVEATIGGILLQIVAQEQDVVPVDGVLCMIGKAGEKAPPAKSVGARQQANADEAQPPEVESNVVPLVQPSPSAAAMPAEIQTSSSAAVQTAEVQATVENTAAQGVITPLARRVARELGIDLSKVNGSGIGGKIIMSDLQPFLAGGNPSKSAPSVSAARSARHTLVSAADVSAAKAPATDFQDVPHTPMRSTVARRMAESKAHIPHFYMTTEIDVAACLALRKRLNEKMRDGHITMNDVMLKATAAALGRVPALNAEIMDGGVRRFAGVHIGFAVAIDEGLVTPVLRDCHIKGIGSIARESTALIERAKSRALKPADMRGGTFTISNLGMHEVVEFSAIINPPQVGILAVARPVERTVVRNGWVVVRPQLNATLSADHRAVDGVTGAVFLAALKELLEDPEQLLL